MSKRVGDSNIGQTFDVSPAANQNCKNMLVLTTAREWRALTEPLPMKQLVSQYRHLLEYIEDIKPFAEQVGGVYMGEDAKLQLGDAQRGLEATLQAMKKRGITLKKVA